MDLCPAQASSLTVVFQQSGVQLLWLFCLYKMANWFVSAIYTLAAAWQALVSFYRLHKRDLSHSPLVCAHPWYFSFCPKKPAPAFSTFKSRHIWFQLLTSIIWVEFLYVKAGSSIQPCVFHYLSHVKYLVRAWTVSEQIVGEGAITTRG